MNYHYFDEKKKIIGRNQTLVFFYLCLDRCFLVEEFVFPKWGGTKILFSEELCPLQDCLVLLFYHIRSHIQIRHYGVRPVEGHLVMLHKIGFSVEEYTIIVYYYLLLRTE